MTALPLEGCKVADFGQVWAGPILSGVLADMGASIVRIESQAGSDGSRMPERQTTESRRRLESYYFFRNRQYYVTLNLGTPQGSELAKEIVKDCDVVVENFAPRVMAKFGLTYGHLREVNPDLIMISMSAAGQTGPLKDLLGYGPSINALAGTDSLVGYPDERHLMANVWDADPTIGNMGAFAVLTALHHKRETGEGQHIDMAFLETLGALLGEGVMEYQMTGSLPTPQGNAHKTMSPHGFYPCEGDDKWISIAVKSTQEWEAFCRAIGEPDWTRHRRFADSFGRLRNREALDELIGEWTARHTPQEATEILQAEGVAAAQALSIPELVHDEHDRYRRSTAHIEVPELEPEQVTYGVQWRLSDTPGSIRRGAARMGADNEQFFTEVLGMPLEEVHRLVEDRIIY